MPITPTSRKSSRQPYVWPSQVPNGTPMTLETVSPAMTIEMAQPALGRSDQ